MHVTMSVTLQLYCCCVCRSTSDEEIGEAMKEHVSIPDFIPPTLSDLSLSWIFMGSPGPGADLHVRMYTPHWVIMGCGLGNLHLCFTSHSFSLHYYFLPSVTIAETIMHARTATSLIGHR